jgi:DnaJ-class molecular chaperone
METDRETCKTCNGSGMASRYDMGWRSLVHSDELAAKRTCVVCCGRGYTLKLSEVVD